MKPQQIDLEEQIHDWTTHAQSKLHSWKQDASNLSHLHDHARAEFTLMRDLLNIPIIALSGLTTVLIGINSIRQVPSETISFTTLVASGFTTFISGVNAFYSPAERVGKHIEAMNAYSSLARNIDFTLHLPSHKKPELEVSYVQITSAFDSIGGNAPPLPMRIRKKANKDEK